MQNLQGQLRGFHFRISFLNPTRVLFFISVGTCSQILGSKYEADSLQLKTLWTGSTRNCVLCLGWCVSSLSLKISFIVSADMPLATLYISIASVWMLLWCTETIIFDKKFLETWTFIIIIDSRLILSSKEQEWNILTTGQ